MRVANCSSALDKHLAPMGPEMLSSTGLSSGGKLQEHWQTPILYWINLGLRLQTGQTLSTPQGSVLHHAKTQNLDFRSCRRMMWLFWSELWGVNFNGEYFSDFVRFLQKKKPLKFSRTRFIPKFTLPGAIVHSAERCVQSIVSLSTVSCHRLRSHKTCRIKSFERETAKHHATLERSSFFRHLPVLGEVASNRNNAF